jgi:hypothetical protein
VNPIINLLSSWINGSDNEISFLNNNLFKIFKSNSKFIE